MTCSLQLFLQLLSHSFIFTLDSLESKRNGLRGLFKTSMVEGKWTMLHLVQLKETAT